MRLDHQVADGDDQAVVIDDDAGAFALATEILNRAPIRIDEGFDRHHAGEELVGGELLGVRGGHRQQGQA